MSFSSSHPSSIIHHLSKEQRKEPLLVLYELFDYAGLPSLKAYLWDWLKLTLTSGYRKKWVKYRERERILLLYEHLEKLLEASYLLYLDRKEDLRLLHGKLREEEWNSKEAS